jgi:hypothetical protein
MDKVPGTGVGNGWAGRGMRLGWKSALTVCGAAAWLVAVSIGAVSIGAVSIGAVSIGAVSAAAMAAGTPAAEMPEALFCDEYNPFAAARVGEVILDASDFADADGTVMLSFIETASIGKVEVEIIRASPARVVRAVSAVPEVSTVSPYFGERLKGIRIAVTLERTRQPVRIVLKLRQVCARHFRNTFLYY